MITEISDVHPLGGDALGDAEDVNTVVVVFDLSQDQEAIGQTQAGCSWRIHHDQERKS